MAQTVQALGLGGQRRAETELGWNRATIRKGMHEWQSGIPCWDAFSSRGRFRAEERLPHLLDDIRELVTAQSQTDPRFRTQRLYTCLTASLALPGDYRLHICAKIKPDGKGQVASLDLSFLPELGFPKRLFEWILHRWEE